MVGEQVQSAGGYSVGEVVRISCEPANARVTRVTAHHVMLEWPWRRAIAAKLHPRVTVAFSCTRLSGYFP